MALIDISKLVEPIDDSAPTGPDLDLEGDPDYMNFVARIEGQFPDSYFRFDRGQIAFESEFETLSQLLARSRDLRLLSILARLQLLNRDPDGFKASLAAVGSLLAERWDDVHPRGEDGDFLFRGVALQALDDPPTVLMPLVHVPLLPGRRAGPLVYRMIQVAQGKVAARVGPDGEPAEEVLEPGVIERAFLEASPDELRARRALFEDIRAAAKVVASITGDKAGDNSVPLDKLIGLTGEIVAYFDAVLAKLEPSTGAGPAGEDAAEGDLQSSAGVARPRIQGRVKTQAHAGAALAALESYFAAKEPSNPSLILVRQARDLVGKSFFDVLRALEPNFADNAVFTLGGMDRMVIPLDRLSGFGGSPESRDDDGDGEEGGGDGSSGADDEDRSADDTDAEPSDPGEEQEANEGSDAGSGADSDGQGDGEGVDRSGDAEESDEKSVKRGKASASKQRSDLQSSKDEPVFKATNRQEAFEILSELESFYRQTEPSSPIPFILTRVRELANKDFLSILKDMIPVSLLRPDRGE